MQGQRHNTTNPQKSVAVRHCSMTPHILVDKKADRMHYKHMGMP